VQSSYNPFSWMHATSRLTTMPFVTLRSDYSWCWGCWGCETGFCEGYCYWRRSREAGRDRVSLYLFPYHPGLLLSFTAYLTDFTQLIENRRSIDRHRWRRLKGALGSGCAVHVLVPAAVGTIDIKFKSSWHCMSIS